MNCFIIEAKYANGHRTRTSLEFCKAWASEKIKMPIAKQEEQVEPMILFISKFLALT